MGSKYQVKIAGQGFLLRPGSYRRTAVALGLEPEGWGWRWWHQSDWRGGDGQRVWSAETRGQGGGERFRTGYGVEVGEAGRVGLGPTLSLSYPSPEDGFAAMLAFLGRLYAVPTSSGKIYGYDGVSWGVEWDTGKGAMASLARHGDRLYAGSGSDGTVFARDGVGWSTAFTVAGVDAVNKVTVPRLFLGCRFDGGEARVYRWDGAAAAEVYRCGEATVEAMAVYGGRLYAATSDGGNGLQGRVLAFDGRGASGEWSEAAWIPDNYVAGWATFDNLLFCGSGAGGKVWAFDGDRLVDAYSLSAPGLEYPDSLRALAVCAGRLYVGYGHPTQGMALLSKLPGVEPRRGWFTPSTTGTGDAPQAMAVYGGGLYMAGGAAGAAPIYRRETGTLRSSGLLESSLFDGGQPGVDKRLRSLSLSHDKLGPGHYLEVSFALEGTDTFQRIEGFDGPAGCDRDSTTADWRTDDSLVRLKGMPAQGFAGKQPGNWAVPHVGRKLTSPNPGSPPAAFVEEFDAIQYAAVSTLGGGVAATVALEGSYAHQLFEFDLAGLNPAGLRPRATCYGRGSSFGVSAPGVLFRMWNHVAGAWDLVGSHTAAPEDDPITRTLEATVIDWDCYVGPTRRLYLSLSAAYASGAAVPSEVGADLVELGALWAEEGVVASRSLGLPVSGPVAKATLTLLDSFTPAGTQIELYLSADGGEHWEPVSDGIEHSFAHPGSDLRWRARLSSAGGSGTPQIDRLKVDCLTGDWLPLGRSDTEGSTSATFPFEGGVAARRVAFRVEMGSADPAGGPALAGIALQYAPQPETKRRWEMDLVCEGVDGVPLRLPDESQEEKTGMELSQILWQARTRGIISFEDLEGGSYQVWFEGLEERLSDAAQERGLQTVARCRLTEC